MTMFFVYFHVRSFAFIVGCVALQCCDKGKTFQCQETCRSALKTGEPDAVGLMVKDCGELLLTEPLWKCFMSKSPPSSPERSANNYDRAINDIRK